MTNVTKNHFIMFQPKTVNTKYKIICIKCNFNITITSNNIEIYIVNRHWTWKNVRLAWPAFGGKMHGQRRLVSWSEALVSLSSNKAWHRNNSTRGTAGSAWCRAKLDMALGLKNTVGARVTKGTICKIQRRKKKKKKKMKWFKKKNEHYHGYNNSYINYSYDYNYIY